MPCPTRKPPVQCSPSRPRASSFSSTTVTSQPEPCSWSATAEPTRPQPITIAFTAGAAYSADRLRSPPAPRRGRPAGTRRSAPRTAPCAARSRPSARRTATAAASAAPSRGRSGRRRPRARARRSPRRSPGPGRSCRSTVDAVVGAEQLRLGERRLGALLLVEHRRVERLLERHADHVQRLDLGAVLAARA